MSPTESATRLSVEKFIEYLAERVEEIQLDQLLDRISKEHELKEAGWIPVDEITRRGKTIRVHGYWRRPGPRGGTLFRSTDAAHRRMVETLR